MRLFGKNPVLERLKTTPETIKKIYLQQGHVEASYVRKKAKKWRIPVVGISKIQMHKMSRNINSQGIFADVDEFQYALYDDILDQALQKKIVLFFLDGLKDPQNLGAILRSLACLGSFAVILPKKESASITPVVCRIACGGENHIPVSIVSNLSQAIEKAKEKGFWITGTFVDEGESLFEVCFSFPLGVVIGSEEKGIRDILRKNIDQKLTIPMHQARLSLNAAQAATLISYEITKQKKK